jgi:phospho-N-acetylmuramoyl-pentapeptide-transferase
MAYLLIHFKVVDTKLYVPFFKSELLDLGHFGYTILVILMLTGFSNAVNLTDGLDGLATGLIAVAAAALALLSYVSGHFEIASYLYVPYIDGSSELTIMMMAVAGSCVGFLWYNAYPAQIFMGDVGSLSLGGILAMAAILTKNEVLFLLVGVLFVIEALSVVMQVVYFKFTRKRLFRMAPIHHHFELSGYHEAKITLRFWLVSSFLSLVGIIGLYPFWS